MKTAKTWPLLLLALAAGVQAQDSSDRNDGSWHASLGMNAGVAPRYFGSDDYRFVIGPEFSITNGTFFLDKRGLGAQYQSDAGFSAAAAISADPGRTENDRFFEVGSKKLKGMGKIKSSALANFSVNQEITPELGVGGDVNLPVAGQKHRGMDYTLGVNSTLPVSESDRLMLGANAHGGSSDYNRTYFGVSPEQSVRSGYRQHQTKAGIYGYSATAGWEHQLDENWTTGTNVGVMHLTGKAGDSPIVKKKTSATGMATVRYNF